jgi:hypothetical protein
MAPRRLIPKSDVDRWEGELRAAVSAAIDEMHGVVLTHLARTVQAPVALVAASSTKKKWSVTRWRQAVRSNVAPAAQKVATEAAAAAKAAFPPAATWGMPDPSGAIASGLVAQVTTAGDYLGERLNQDVATASDPSAAAAAVFATAVAIVGGQLAASAEGAANAASATTSTFLSSAASPTDTSGATQTWNAVGDDRTRETHADADGQEVPLGDSFDVGDDQLAYPGDPLGSAEETINCRCWLTFDGVESQAQEDAGDQENEGEGDG